MVQRAWDACVGDDDVLLAARICGWETGFQLLRAEVTRLGFDALVRPSINLGTDTAHFLT